MLPLFTGFSSALHACAHIPDSKVMLTPALVGRSLLFTLDGYVICDAGNRSASLRLLDTCVQVSSSHLFLDKKMMADIVLINHVYVFFFKEECVYSNFY